MNNIIKTFLFAGIFAYVGINDVFAMNQGAAKNNLDGYVRADSPTGMVVSPKHGATQKQLRRALEAYVQAALTDTDDYDSECGDDANEEADGRDCR